MPNAQVAIFLVVAGIFLAFVLIVLTVVVKFFASWLQAFTAGVPISVLQIVGMRLRKVDERLVIRSLIMATQAGVPVPSIEMERAYLQGVDLEKITLALIHAHRAGKKVTLQQLVEADLENRLQEKLGIGSGGRW